MSRYGVKDRGVLIRSADNGSRSIQVVEWLALQTSDHNLPGSNPAGGRIEPMTVLCFIAQSLSLSHFHYLDMT